MCAFLLLIGLVSGGIYFCTQTNKDDTNNAYVLDLSKITPQITLVPKQIPSPLEEYEYHLKNLQNSRGDLQKFLEKQKNQVIEYEKTIKELEDRINRLTSLVNTKQETVNALFQEQEERRKKLIRKEIWRERGYGVIISIVGGAIFYFLRILFKRKIAP